ncbi:hypothetical protein XSP_000130 [Xanthomonas euroxanthea]|uniref:Uncharacterized protein n=1 Tax=Xanthomonas euroxanthea TaxID=2259622 RepID=A0A8E4EK48_9XANT|nr:hypothetical protein [Xanthomonas euroxanthea]CAD1786042.1 hypothetical protein XSP_000130 [Xanthomonas euroxanthea]
MLTELRSILQSALSNWLNRPVVSIAGLSMVSSGLPLMVVSKLFSVGAKVSVTTRYVTGDFQVDNSNETLIFVSGLALVAVGALLISWATLANRPAQSDAKSKLTSLLQSSTLNSNTEIQHHFKTAYGYSTDVAAIRAILNSSDPDMFAMDFHNSRGKVAVVGSSFQSVQGYCPRAARKLSNRLYFIVAFLAICCFAGALQPWWPTDLMTASALIFASFVLAALCIPILSKIKRSSAALRLTT